MNFAAFTQATAVVQLHTLAAFLALAIGAGVLFARKGTAAHLWVGRLWVAIMVLVAVSSFWITSLRPGSFSPIHLLSVLTLIALPYAIWARRRGFIGAHKRAMIATFAGLLIAGAFTLMPGRVLHKTLFGGPAVTAQR